MMRAILCCALMLFIVAAYNAAAHGVNLLVLPDGDSIRGHVSFADGSPVAGVDVEVRNTAGEAIGVVATDADGRFEYRSVPKTDLVFVVETDDGHRAESAWMRGSLDTDESAAEPAPATGPVVDSQLQRTIQHELAPLREQLDAYQREIRFRDIVGGIGYIVGVIGLMAWVKARRLDRAP